MRWMTFQIDVGFKDDTVPKDPMPREVGQAMVDLFNADMMDRGKFVPSKDPLSYEPDVEGPR